MVSCPKCGQPLMKKGRKRRYYCDNESCPVIFVRNPYEPDKRATAYASVAGAKIIEKTQCRPRVKE